MGSLYFAGRANMNTGIITVIWAMNPLIVAIMEYIGYKVSLSYNHAVGMMAVIVCAVLLSLSGIVKEREIKKLLG